MEFNLAEKVRYKGGEIIYDLEPGTNNPLTRMVAPTDGTYIWQVVKSINDGIVYIIEHTDGVKVDYFTKYAKYIGEVDISRLSQDKKYILVPGGKLESMEENKEKTQSMVQAAQPINEVLEKDEIEDIPTRNESKNEVEQPPVEPVITETNIHQEPIDYGKPHYTIETAPINTMIDVIPKLKVLKGMKSPQPFIVTSPHGTAEGTAGDYLLVDGDLITICGKADFDEYFETAEQLSEIIYLGKTFTVLPGVAEYISELEKTNNELVVELLKTNQDVK